MELKLTLDRIEEDKAVLKTEDNQIIIWPCDKLPDGIKEGMVLSFNIDSNNEMTADKKQLAKDILNEILTPDDDQTND